MVSKDGGSAPWQVADSEVYHRTQFERRSQETRYLTAERVGVSFVGGLVMPRYRVESGFRVAIVEASSPKAAVVLAERQFSAAARRPEPLGRPPLSEVVEVTGERMWIDPWAGVERPAGVP